MRVCMRVPILALFVWVIIALSGATTVAANERPAKVHVVSFALFSDLAVFAKEAEKAARIVHQSFGHRGEVIVRVNTRRRREVTITDLGRTLEQIGARMDRENDVLFVFVTSHGTRSGALIKAGAMTEMLSPADLAEMLTRAGIRRRIVVVSACFSGVFADALADPATLVITAANQHQPSFGCRPGADWTYFGKAFFADALPRTKTLAEAFTTATALVAKREAAQRLAHSRPMMAGGELVLARLSQAAEPRPAPASAEPAAAQALPRATCVVKVEPMPGDAACQVFTAYSEGQRVGYFRVRAGKSDRAGVAAGGTCPRDFVAGAQVASNKVRTRGQVYTLGPDCRSAERTTQ